ncbi:MULTISPECIES: hypothetical protein [Pseudomonadota]|jgi:hypothetical protein|uniref:Uncharacterized protein n=10 Tax=Pseudomonadota TaxID=1224 RepID=A0A401J8N0_SPHXE|nr:MULTISPECIES: hypothetical protein [Sphingomonadaceae]ANI80348.1 hypothetical protein EP837_03970 [Sphingobium sp. EP60837]WIW91153.1 hypothetical protein K3M67_21775 [Sphingobium sp. V4]WQE09999.1 hypothetical protein U0025_25365 [Sphingobium yanoikuyae]GBH32997.1 hypothetical protein MBESOW_P4405 [Sphingobium xenophagum]|tara:strand:- start:44 stop:304 length:261 start_codon:yes stop_codon:yes gene_type:complete
MSSNPPREFDRLLQDAPLVRAMGGALSMFATLLARQGIVEASEVANLLGIYAVATSEVDNEEGMILGCWAAMIRDVAEQQRTSARK